MILLALCSGIFSLPLGMSAASNSAVQDKLLWKFSVPPTNVTEHDFDNNYWSYNESQAFGAPTVVGGVVFVGNEGGQHGGKDRGTYAFNAYNGQIIWKYNLIYPSNGCSPVVNDGAAYIGSFGGLYALSASDGSKLWDYSDQYVYLKNGTGGPIYRADFSASPLVFDGIVYAVSSNGNLIAFNSVSGKIVWSNYIAREEGTWPWYATFTTPVLVNGVLYIGSQDHSVYALSASDGRKIWNFTTGEEVYYPPTVSNNVVYVTSYDGNIYALNAANGRKLWNFTVAADVEGIRFVDSSPTLSNGVIFVGCDAGVFYALKASDGKLLWSFNTGSSVSTPTVVDSVVYFGTGGDNDTLFAFTVDGTELWSFKTDGGVSTPAIADGIIYVGTDSGSIYAIGSLPSGLLGLWVALSNPNVAGPIAIALAASFLIAAGIVRQRRKQNKSLTKSEVS
jgi:outer membrane protein assembly factor BamB